MSFVFAFGEDKLFKKKFIFSFGFIIGKTEAPSDFCRFCEERKRKIIAPLSVPESFYLAAKPQERLNRVALSTHR